MTGRYWGKNKNGYLENDSNWSLIDRIYLSPIKDIKNFIIGHYHDKVQALYLTGSISRGLAKPDYSDADLFIVSKPNAIFSNEDEQKISRFEKTIEDRYKFITDVQIEIWPWDYVFLPNNKFSIAAFVIKSHSVFLLGDDISNQIEPYKLSKHIANDDVVQIKSDIDEALKEIKGDPSEQNVAYWCKRIMKNIIRALYGLVMIDVDKFTRDIDLCVDCFLTKYPEKLNEIIRARDLVNNPTHNKEVLIKFLEDFGEWVIDEANIWLDKYNPNREVAMDFGA